MGGFVRKVTKTAKRTVKKLGVGKVVDMVGGMNNNQAAEAAQAQALQQQLMFEQQLRQQNEAAKLQSANMLDNVVNVQTGDTLAAIDGLTTSKRKRTEGMGISSALGIS